MNTKNSTGLLAFVTTVILLGSVAYVAKDWVKKVDITQKRDDVALVVKEEPKVETRVATAEQTKEEDIIIDEYTPRSPIIEEEELNARLKETQKEEEAEKAKRRPVKADVAPEPKPERKSVTRRVIEKFKFKPKKPFWVRKNTTTVAKKPVIKQKPVQTVEIRPAPKGEEFDPFFVPKAILGTMGAIAQGIIDAKRKMLGLDG